MKAEVDNMSGVFTTAPQLCGAPCQGPEELHGLKWALECIAFLCLIRMGSVGVADEHFYERVTIEEHYMCQHNRILSHRAFARVTGVSLCIFTLRITGWFMCS